MVITTKTTPQCLVEWAGLLSTQNFSDKHPDKAYKFLKDFEKFLRKRIWDDVEFSIREPEDGY